MLASMILPGLIATGLAAAAPLEDRSNSQQYYEVQGHRGARGEVVESTLAAFAKNLIDGAVTMELDTGVTKDGHLIVWHDEQIDGAKCKDTAPAWEGDEMFPYVGKYITNLTLAQLKTLDCGSKRLPDFPLAFKAPGIKLATLPELFDFVDCTGSSNLFNIETKINPIQTNRTQTPEVFLEKLLPVLQDYNMVERTTHQSFDWRSIKLSKEKMPQLATSALVGPTTTHARRGEPDATSGPSDWLAGIDIDSFDGQTQGERIVQAAHSIKANRLSPRANGNNNTEALDPSFPDYDWFTTPKMVSKAHELGMTVAVWTVNRLATFEALYEFGTNAVITDHPEIFLEWAKIHGENVPDGADKDKVMKCFKKHAEFVADKYL